MTRAIGSRSVCSRDPAVAPTDSLVRRAAASPGTITTVSANVDLT